MCYFSVVSCYAELDSDPAAPSTSLLVSFDRFWSGKRKAKLLLKPYMMVHESGPSDSQLQLDKDLAQLLC